MMCEDTNGVRQLVAAAHFVDPSHTFRLSTSLSKRKASDDVDTPVAVQKPRIEPEANKSEASKPEASKPEVSKPEASELSGVAERLFDMSLHTLQRVLHDMERDRSTNYTKKRISVGWWISGCRWLLAELRSREYEQRLADVIHMQAARQFTETITNHTMSECANCGKRPETNVAYAFRLRRQCRNTILPKLPIVMRELRDILSRFTEWTTSISSQSSNSQSSSTNSDIQRIYSELCQYYNPHALCALQQTLTQSGNAAIASLAVPRHVTRDTLLAFLQGASTLVRCLIARLDTEASAFRNCYDEMSWRIDALEKRQQQPTHAAVINVMRVNNLRNSPATRESPMIMRVVEDIFESVRHQVLSVHMQQPSSSSSSSAGSRGSGNESRGTMPKPSVISSSKDDDEMKSACETLCNQMRSIIFLMRMCDKQQCLTDWREAHGHASIYTSTAYLLPYLVASIRARATAEGILAAAVSTPAAAESAPSTPVSAEHDASLRAINAPIASTPLSVHNATARIWDAIHTQLTLELETLKSARRTGNVSALVHILPAIVLYQRITEHWTEEDQLRITELRTQLPNELQLPRLM